MVAGAESAVNPRGAKSIEEWLKEWEDKHKGLEQESSSSSSASTTTATTSEDSKPREWNGREHV